MKKAKDYNKNYFGCSDRKRSEDKATSELLKIAKNFERISDSIHEILVPSGNPCMTTSRFMQEGIRTNGLLERSGSLSHLFYKCTYYLYSLGEAEKDTADRRAKVQKMLSLLDGYKICEECSGDRGELLGPNYFEDCSVCDGQGMVKK